MTEKSHEEASEMLAERAAQVQRGAARAAVLGVNDGLVSILCLVIGVAAAGAEARAVLIAGFAGLLAGAISMAAGEWISVKAQVELFENVLSDIKKITRNDKELLEQNLTKNFIEHGIDEKTAKQAVADVSARDETFVSMYSNQVVGLNDDELGSPWVAAGSSFVLFSFGAIPPLFPWIIGMHGMPGIILAIVLTGLGSLFVGGYTAQSSGKSVVPGAIRQLGIVIFAAVVTYGIGYIFGVSVA
ncbi:VIT1/CCC1 transporter family protein [Candidatus Saccharibacteria bacterium]|nr:VIT1/CCC1 transporter family protein [Candidatus Saccharibacteria bacterium]